MQRNGPSCGQVAQHWPLTSSKHGTVYPALLIMNSLPAIFSGLVKKISLRLVSTFGGVAHAVVHGRVMLNGAVAGLAGSASSGLAFGQSLAL